MYEVAVTHSGLVLFAHALLVCRRLAPHHSSSMYLARYYYRDARTRALADERAACFFCCKLHVGHSELHALILLRWYCMLIVASCYALDNHKLLLQGCIRRFGTFYFI